MWFCSCWRWPAFLVFCSFHIESIGPKQSVTVGLNMSPWLTFTRVKGLGDFGKKAEFNILSWSVAGLAGGLLLLALRSRIK